MVISTKMSGCGCQKISCMDRRCGCMKNGRNCSFACRCVNCQNRGFSSAPTFAIQSSTASIDDAIVRMLRSVNPPNTYSSVTPATNLNSVKSIPITSNLLKPMIDVNKIQCLSPQKVDSKSCSSTNDSTNRTNNATHDKSSNQSLLSQTVDSNLNKPGIKSSSSCTTEKDASELNGEFYIAQMKKMSPDQLKNAERLFLKVILMAQEQKLHEKVDVVDKQKYKLSRVSSKKASSEEEL